MKFHDIPIINSHVHAPYHMGEGVGKIEKLDFYVRQITEECNVEAFTAVTTASRCGTGDLQKPLCMLLKAMYPDQIYIFGSLEYPREGEADGHDFLKQAQRLMDIGFDGIKMIEGKPNVRKWTRIPLNSDVYDEFYSYLQKEEIPITFHVADPDIYWDEEKCPRYARENHWDYLDGTFVSKEGLHKEAEGILEKFPKLNIIFAHFYFMSKEPERGGAFLDRWQNVSFDITPGSHEYENFARIPAVWREFFTKYQDRILFGTDSFLGFDNNIELSNDVRMFLESKGEYTFKSHGCKTVCLGLERDVLEKIYKQNYMRYVKGAPRKLNKELALAECRRAAELADGNSMEQEVGGELDAITRRLKGLL